MRWQNRDINLEAFMPFSVGRFRCPTQGTMGPRLLGILIGALLVRTHEDVDLEGQGLDEVRNSKMPLQADRQAYPNIRFRRTKVSGPNPLSYFIMDRDCKKDIETAGYLGMHAHMDSRL